MFNICHSFKKLQIENANLTWLRSEQAMFYNITVFL